MSVHFGAARGKLLATPSASLVSRRCMGHREVVVKKCVPFRTDQRGAEGERLFASYAVFASSKKAEAVEGEYASHPIATRGRKVEIICGLRCLSPRKLRLLRRSMRCDDKSSNSNEGKKGKRKVYTACSEANHFGIEPL